MPPKTSPGSIELGASIKLRRNDLGLTIDEAASKAGVSSKTWIRYESGESIRKDKVIGVLRALKWKGFPDNDETEAGEDPFANLDETHAAWSSQLAEVYGRATAAFFAVGSDIALDQAEEDLFALAHMPRYSHVGELGSSWLESNLPQQFLTRCDYEFVYALVHAIKKLRMIAKTGRMIVAHSVMEELALYQITLEAETYFELFDISEEYEDECPEGLFASLCGDDLELFLFDDLLLIPEGHAYHFDRWGEEQFYLDGD